MRTSTVVRTSPRIFFLQYPDACDQASTIKHPEVTIFEITASLSLPWVPEVFLACGGNFPCWPKAEATSGEAARGHYKDLTETGNRARKVSGTQGTLSLVIDELISCFLDNSDQLFETT